MYLDKDESNDANDANDATSLPRTPIGNDMEPKRRIRSWISMRQILIEACPACAMKEGSAGCKDDTQTPHD